MFPVIPVLGVVQLRCNFGSQWVRPPAITSHHATSPLLQLRVTPVSLFIRFSRGSKTFRKFFPDFH